MNEEEFFNQEFENCRQVQQVIDELEDNCPDRRTKEYNKWKEKINFLFESYNFFCKFTAYKKIK